MARRHIAAVLGFISLASVQSASAQDAGRGKCLMRSQGRCVVWESSSKPATGGDAGPAREAVISLHGPAAKTDTTLAPSVLQGYSKHLRLLSGLRRPKGALFLALAALAMILIWAAVGRLASPKVTGPPADMLAAAVRLSEGGRHSKALSLMTDAVLLAAAKEQDLRAKVVGVYRKADRCRQFLSGRCHKRTPSFCRSYAASFHEAGDPQTCLALLQRMGSLEPEDYGPYVACHKELGRLKELESLDVPLERRTAFAQALADVGEERAALRALTGDTKPTDPPGYALALRLCGRLNDFETAQKLYEEVEVSFGVKIAPELHYLFGLICESAGRMNKARGIYHTIQKWAADYRDTPDRLKKLDAISAEEMTRLTATLKAVSSPDDAPLAPGQVVGGKYELRRPLGVGGMGVVYHGWDRMLSRPVAVKRLHDEVSRDSAVRDAFVQEARLVAALNHAYIVAIHDIVMQEGELHLVFEYVEGENFHQLIAGRGRIPPAECVRVFGFVCEALAFAHEKGIIHRDVKPANIMMDRRGYVKVMDFGIAGHSGGGPVAGTLAYMPPEQHSGRTDARSDVYSLGVTLYEMLAGEAPWKGPDFFEQKTRMEYRRVSEAARLPSAWDEVIGRSLQADPSCRHASVREFMDAVRKAATTQTA